MDELYIKYIPLQQVVLWDTNPKLHNIDELVESIERHGFKDPPKFEPKLNNGQGGIVEGNGRVETLLTMKEQGKEIPRGIQVVEETDDWAIPILFGVDEGSETAAQAYGITHNNLVMSGGDFTALDMAGLWDAKKYSNVLQSLADENVYAVSVTADDMNALKKASFGIWKDEPPDDPGAEIDRAEELREKWGVESGQLWQLGKHRLICGDCTDVDVVSRVMDGEKAGVVFADPPYPNNSNIMIDMVDDAISSFDLSRKICTDVMFWFWDFLTEPPFFEQVNARHVWHKTNGWQAGHWEAINQYCGDDIRRESWVYSFPNVGNNVLPRKDVGNHLTPKPVELVEEILSKQKEVVYDPFLGSGTTLIACERLGHKCRACEISPAYVGVTLERYFQMTGDEPILCTK